MENNNLKMSLNPVESGIDNESKVNESNRQKIQK